MNEFSIREQYIFFCAAESIKRFRDTCMHDDVCMVRCLSANYNLVVPRYDIYIQRCVLADVSCVPNINLADTRRPG